MSIHGILVSSIVIVALVGGCGQKDQARSSEAPAGAISVNAARLLSAGADSDNWLSHGRPYGEQRFSPLSQITMDNVSELGLAWYFDILRKHWQRINRAICIDVPLTLDKAREEFSKLGPLWSK